MTIKFAAENIHTEKTDDHIMVGFADGQDVVHDFIVTMRVLRTGENIPAEIVAKPYFEYCEEENSGYGCISQITLRSDRAIFKIDTAKCPDIPDPEFVVTFDIDRTKLAQVAEYLGEIIKDDGVLKIIGD